MAEKDDLEAATARVKELEAEAEKWKALSRKNEEQSKKNAEAADELKKLKESSLSDQQKREAAEKAQADKLSELEKRANEADARALRAEVAGTKKLTSAQASRLRGDTREELEADADELLTSFKPAEPGGEGGGTSSNGGTPSKPKEDLSGGGDPTQEPTEMNPRKLAADVPRY